MTLPNPKIKMHFLIISTILHCHCSSSVASIKLCQLNQYCHSIHFETVKSMVEGTAIAAEDNKF